jgi:hypothetical protein
MNGWIRICLPILIAVLLVVATVGITLAAARSGDQVASGYRTGYTGYTGGAQYAQGPRYGVCPDWTSNYNGAGQGWCWNYNS